MNAIDDCTITAEPDPTTTTTVHHDWDEDESIAVSIVAAIARLAGTDPEDVPQLYDRLDPDGLEALFAPTVRSGDRNSGHLWVPIGEYGVTIYADGTIVVQSLA